MLQPTFESVVERLIAYFTISDSSFFLIFRQEYICEKPALKFFQDSREQLRQHRTIFFV